MSSITRPVVAIAGATGHLGKHVTTAFLSSTFQDKFSEIILLSRNESCLFQPSSSQSGVKLTARRYNENNLEETLQGIQILVNAIGPTGHDFKTKIAAALPRTDIQVYFPSEFGVDHYGHNFVHLEWHEKKKHLANAQPVVTHMKICRVFCGLFLEDSIGPWFGLDTQNGKYTSVGSFRTRVSFTSLGDVGRTVASLATMPVEKIPNIVHVGGDSRSVAEIAGIMESAGAGRIDIDCLPYEEYKTKTIAKPSWDPAPYMWFLMGDGSIAHIPGCLGNDNDLVNPDQKLWKWKTVEDLAKETNGQPVKEAV
ncbi:uncharacterized protein PGRI_000640 [Penicillium griseofulvum]|uniref:NmrA-like domain-containing protein n=1 Tax=Penicillium patulum TaxID=5078 RepID=A0A135LVL4_PENPA|nr:uncharacterized protein PGRI_000640 [Penicillium griseofulvum]KXG53014.1 hypothetical protein PGRI_000640 [Penicillium griseofulvum]